MNTHVGNCPRCGINARLRIRDFSDQAITALVIWGELEERVVSHAICDDCHDELREVLIERNEEISSPQKFVSEPVAKPQPRKQVAAKEAAVKEEKPAKAPAAKAAKPAAKTPAAKTTKKKTATSKGKKIKRAG